MDIIESASNSRVRFLETTSKFILCVLRTQLGKTYTAISKILAEIRQDDELGKSIHIIFTMNTLLNNKQFAKRLETIEQTYGKGSICVFSSKYNGKYRHVKSRLELLGLCADESTCPRVVLMCSNKCRYDDGLEFIKVIDKNRYGICRVFAYYDELHEYITDTLRDQIEQIHDLDIIKGITALTASPDRIWQAAGFWSKIRLIQLDDFSDANYAGCNDMIFNCVDDYFATPYIRPNPFDFDEMDRQTIGFIETVLRKSPEILGENTRSFIPAHIRRSGHNIVRDLVLSINPTAIVAVINGDEKTLQYKDRFGNTKTLSLLSEDEELCETISRVVLQHKLQHRPIVITGLLCVGMGQTLTHKSLGSFTSAIFSHLNLTNDEIYQLFGRITGRMKDWGDKYVQTQVYCPTITMNRAIVIEECARNMSCEHNGEVVSQVDYREPMTEMGEVGQSAIENIRIPKKKKSTTPVVDKYEMCTTVPIVIPITEEQFATIWAGKGSKWNFPNLFGCLDPELRGELLRISPRPIDHECPDPNKPGYKKKITDNIEAKDKNEKRKTWASEIKKNPTRDYYVIYLDQLAHRIIVSIYYGSRFTTSAPFTGEDSSS
jgi:hypothetical protein